MPVLPKPLSDKTISRMLSGWKPETVDALHDFYAECSNLYGVIDLDSAWKIFKTCHKGILKREFMEFSSIARREQLPYYVLEVDEVYSAEPRKTEDRYIVNKMLVNNGYYKLVRLYDVLERQVAKPYYVPDDMSVFLDADGLDVNESWKALRSMIRFIKSPKGLPLCKYKHISKKDKAEEVLYTTERQKAEYRAELARPLSDRILDELKLWMQIGLPFYKYIAGAFDEHNILLSEKELRKILTLVMDANNTANLWINAGWSPNELSQWKNNGNSQPPMITFGPGIKSAVAKGDMDKDELLAGLDELGIKYSWE